jgi:hypothetical protein
MQNEQGDLNMKLNRPLMQYRKAPNSTARQSPAELMFKRNITTEMNEKSTAHHVKIREFKVCDKVQIKMGVPNDIRENWLSSL